MTDFKSYLSELNKNLNILEERRAKYAGNSPLELLNQIEDHKKAIELTEQAIAGEMSEAEWKEALKSLNVALDRQQAVMRLLDEEQFQATILQDYFTTMTGLILDRGLRESQPGAPVRGIARTHTLSVLQGLNSARNQRVVQFLREQELFEPREAAIVNLAQSTLEGAELELVNFEKTDLREVNLSRAKLKGAGLSQAELVGAKLIEANLDRANLTLSDLSRAMLAMANIHGANLEGATLIGADLTKATLVLANLSRANLYGAILDEADLNLANLSAANLSRAHFGGANLSRANLDRADLSDAELNGADLHRAVLTDAVLDRIKLVGVKYTTDTKWPSPFDPAHFGAILDNS